MFYNISMNRVIYSCNDKYFDGLYLSILSILRRSKEVYEFSILTANLPNIGKNYTSLSSYHIELLDKLVKDFNPNNTIRVIDCSEQYVKVFGLQDVNRYSPYTMLKLFIPECYESGKVLYIDTDIMANGDVNNIFTIDVSDVEMCVCHDYYRQVKLKNPDSTYFSGGVWLINIDRVKETKLFNKAIDYFNRYHPFGNEEASLNETVSTIKYFPNNDYDYNWQGPGIGPNTILKHFVYTGEQVNIKQWDIVGVRRVLELLNWDEDYKYYETQQATWIKPKQIYKVLYSCNDGLFDGLVLSILSILRRTKEVMHFYVLTADLTFMNPNYKALSAKHIAQLEQLIKAFNPSNSLTILDAKDKYIKQLGDKYDVVHFTPYALFRLLIDQFNELDDLILYLDVDTLANADIAQVWNTDMNCVEICVCKDYWLNNNKQSEYPMFNSGVMLINLDFIRMTKYFTQAIHYLIDKKPKMADQQALFDTWYRIFEWDAGYRYNYQQLGIQQDTVIKHFNVTESNSVNGKVIKPWNINDVMNVLNLHNWDVDFQLFLQLKKAWGE